MRKLLLAVSVVMAGCSTSTEPQPGTPAWAWSAAKEAFAAGDYVKTAQHLDKVQASENEYTARARPMYLILTSGMARGYMDLADNLEYGVRAKKADPGGFRKTISNSRSTAGRLSLQFAEAFMSFQKGKDDPILLDFTFPSGSAVAVPELTRASIGQPLQPPEIESAQRHAIQRAILLQLCVAAGASDDTAKALDIFKSGSAKVPRAAFMTGMANTLYDEAQLFGPRKLDDPEKLKVFSNLASSALKDVPETKQTKDLSAKIQTGMKKK